MKLQAQHKCYTKLLSNKFSADATQTTHKAEITQNLLGTT